MSTSQPNFRPLITLAEVATRGLTSDPLVPIGDLAASFASHVLSPSQPGAPLIGGSSSGSLLRPEPYATPIRASVGVPFYATPPFGAGADHRHLAAGTAQADALPGSHMTTSSVRDGYQVRQPPVRRLPHSDGALPDGHKTVPLPQDNIPPWPAQSATPIGVNAAGGLIELPADNVHPLAPCDPAPFRAGASPVCGPEDSPLGDGPRAPPVSSAAPLRAGAGSFHALLLQKRHRETGQAAANETGGSTEGWSTWFCSSAVGVPGRCFVRLVVSVFEWLEAWPTRALVGRFVSPDTREGEQPGMAGHFVILETTRHRRLRLRRRRRALGPGVNVAEIAMAGQEWRGRRRRQCPGLGDCLVYFSLGRDRRGGPGQNRILGSGRCSPAPLRATPVGSSVAIRTSQEGTEPPRFFVSRKPWRNQRRPEPGQALDRVPWLLRGRTVNEMDTQAQGACLPSRPGNVFCHICGRLLLHGDGHDRSLFHRSRANAGDGDVIGQRRMDDSAEHPDTIRCFGARLARDPVFAAATLAAAGLQGVAASAPATVPPGPPKPPIEEQAGPSELQDLIDEDIDLDLL
ncbi:hypothetical protein HPB47_027856 [Ixodes persulcatus]|uniref:Uncharacterized protein n=1 Tax=Ixodes persulcatus TaxID=34615 RepID=A0AC60PVA4_IXOPE|nr:hypothetical protein HPB47_027856 [Ixodes persulcatus]